MPADGAARHVLSPPTRQRGRPGLRISVAGAGHPSGTLPPPTGGPTGPRGAPPGGLICFSSRHRSCIVEFSPTLSSLKSGASTCRRPYRRPIWPVCVPRPANRAWIYRMPRTYPWWPPRDGEAWRPFLRLSPKLAHSDGDSIIPDLPTENILL